MDDSGLWCESCPTYPQYSSIGRADIRGGCGVSPHNRQVDTDVVTGASSSPPPQGERRRWRPGRPPPGEHRAPADSSGRARHRSHECHQYIRTWPLPRTPNMWTHHLPLASAPPSNLQGLRLGVLSSHVRLPELEPPIIGGVVSHRHLVDLTRRRHHVDDAVTEQRAYGRAQ